MIAGFLLLWVRLAAAEIGLPTLATELEKAQAATANVAFDYRRTTTEALPHRARSEVVGHVHRAADGRRFLRWEYDTRAFSADGKPAGGTSVKNTSVLSDDFAAIYRAEALSGEEVYPIDFPARVPESVARTVISDGDPGDDQYAFGSPTRSLVRLIRETPADDLRLTAVPRPGAAPLYTLTYARRDAAGRRRDLYDVEIDPDQGWLVTRRREYDDKKIVREIRLIIARHDVNGGAVFFPAKVVDERVARQLRSESVFVVDNVRFPRPADADFSLARLGMPDGTPVWWDPDGAGEERISENGTAVAKSAASPALLERHRDYYDRRLRGAATQSADKPRVAAPPTVVYKTPPPVIAVVSPRRVWPWAAGGAVVLLTVAAVGFVVRRGRA